MPDGMFFVPEPSNEPILTYEPGSPEREAIEAELASQLSTEIEIPVIIGGKEIRTGRTDSVVCPHDHGHRLATVHLAGEAEVAAAAEASAAAWAEWSEMPYASRAAIFLKAAERLSGSWRAKVNAATMLNQSKTVYQAEIDSACELIDFWRFNASFGEQILAEQPNSSEGVWNLTDYRPLEGFVFAVTPFNFTAIGGNLPTAPALMGNTVLWKPATTAVYSNYHVMKLLEECGLPPGVINFLPGHGAEVGDPAFAHPQLAGVHFTGSTGVFQHMWRTIGNNIASYRSYPRIVGETGGKDFVFAHPSADPVALATALVRGAFEYQGQKCSAASRAYIPRSLYGEVLEAAREQLEHATMGPVHDLSYFMGAVIDEKSFNNISGYIDEAKKSSEYEVLSGGGCDKSIGYFVEPTLVLSSDPKSRLMREEIFGPVLTLYVYEDGKLDEALELCDTTSPYALTGAIFAQDRGAIVEMTRRLRHAAGNFYINDKPTGAVVGQQPFGGARASGTNDKAGSAVNLLRWTSQRSIKETFSPPVGITYPHMD
jgi:1-pyrroline-5-carboxylate dehydrogenase